MEDVLHRARSDLSITHVAFGDLFLEDVRRYRMEMMKGSGLTPIFPLWGLATDALARQTGVGRKVECSYLHIAFGNADRLQRLQLFQLQL